MRGSSLLLLILLCLRAAGAEHPNIVYILADDLGYGDVHSLNPERGKIATPNLDRLASEGMSFSEAHSGSSVCTPTRYGVLTGRYSWRSKLQNGVLKDYEEPLITADRLTVPALLKQSGYHTSCIGKWHLGFTIEGGAAKPKPVAKAADGGKTTPEDRRAARKKERSPEDRSGAPLGAVTHDGPITRGFDSYYGFHHARMMRSIFDNDRVTEMIDPIDLLPALVKRSQSYLTERAKSGEPFFLYFALNSPHVPIVPSAEWKGKSGLGDYGDFVMETDWAVGEVLAALKTNGLAEKTLVIFTSDNGCSPAAKTARLEAQGHFASAERRGYKADIWDGGHRVPFLVRWPGKVQAGAHSSQLICHTDLMATCAELLGVTLPPNAGEDSVSILPALLGRDSAPLHEAVIHHSITGKFAVRQGEWKLEICPGSGGWGSPGDEEAAKQGLPNLQLYDCAHDPGEKKNLQAEHPEIVERLTALLERYVADGRSTPGPKQKKRRPRANS